LSEPRNSVPEKEIRTYRGYKRQGIADFCDGESGHSHGKPPVGPAADVPTPHKYTQAGSRQGAYEGGQCDPMDDHLSALRIDRATFPNAINIYHMCKSHATLMS